MNERQKVGSTIIKKARNLAADVLNFVRFISSATTAPAVTHLSAL